MHIYSACIYTQPGAARLRASHAPDLRACMLAAGHPSTSNSERVRKISLS